MMSLSSAQFERPSSGLGQSSMTASGASPISSKFDGPAPIKISSSQNNMAANSGTAIAKPGFF